MPLSDKLGRPFELLSIRRHRKKEDENVVPTSTASTHALSHHHPPHASAAYMPATQPTNPFHHHQQPSTSSATAAATGGFYPSVQYERLTPSVNQRPPVPGGVPASSSSSSFTSGIQYERLAPSASNRHSPNVVQYERLTPSGPRPPSIPSIRQNSPLDYEMRPRPAGYVRDSPSPSLASLPSPGMLTPLATDPSSVGRSPLEPRPLAPAAAAAARAQPSPGIAGLGLDRGSSSGSDKSTPFSYVMEEWMSQLRTPTPDVTLLPSPYDFNKDTPTPVERAEDLKHIHNALLPTPPPDVHDQNQNPKSSEYILNVSRRPLVEDIASLCRDLISHDASRMQAYPLPASIHQQQQQQIQLKKFPGVGHIPETEVKRDVRMRDEVQVQQQQDEYDDEYDEYDDDDKTSTTGSSKGKRRKMCTSEGCTNLSRSRGLCKAHGGGRRCSVDGCTRASQSGSLCITHGGGKRCTVDGCIKAAQSRGMCKAHGGGVRCRIDGCTKSSQGDGFCRSHGGGRRCGHPDGCTKWAQRNGMCMAHSEGKYGNSYRGRLYRMTDGERQEL